MKTNIILNRDKIVKMEYVNRYERIYDHIKKVHSKGSTYEIKKRPAWLNGFFPARCDQLKYGEYKENMYRFIDWDYEVGKIIERIIPQSKVKDILDTSKYEFGPFDHIYYKPHIYTRAVNDDTETFVFDTQEELDNVVSQFLNGDKNIILTINTYL